jgi:hypothetical protein
MMAIDSLQKSFLDSPPTGTISARHENKAAIEAGKK